MRVAATEGEARSENWDFTRPGVLALATSYYAGPFCSCGDYSCRAMNNPTAPCDNRPDAASSFYPDSWSDADIDAYELQRELDDVTWCNQQDATRATAQLNHLNRIDNTPRPNTAINLEGLDR